MTTQKITTFLWFDNKCEEAINYYVSVFNNSPKADPNNPEKQSRINSIQYYPDEMGDIPGGPEMKGKVITAVFTLNGQQFMALDGGPIFTFSEAVSLLIDCEDQQEVDYYWDTFIKDGGQESQCGWLKDKYGFSWQISPSAMGALFSSPDREKANRAIQAMMTMKKLDINELQKAFDGS